MIKVAMFDTKPYDKESFEKVPHEGISFTYFDTGLDESTVMLAKGFDCVCVFVNDSVNEAVIEKLHSFGIKLIALRCAGFNNVDVQAAFGKIHVVRVPSYSPEAVAEHTMALLLSSARRIHKAYNRTREYNFSLAGLTGINLHGKTVGIVGAGKIGKAFIRICAGFGMRVLAYDLYPSTDIPAEFVDLDTLYKECDIISLHCPLTEDNHHMIDKESISKMKDGVILLNTSRGGLINAEALLEAIKSKKVGAACLDVYEEESDLFFDDMSGHILQDDILARLLTMPNVIITSHQAFLTEEALASIADTTVGNIKAYYDGKPLINEICYRCDRVEECMKNRLSKCF